LLGFIYLVVESQKLNTYGTSLNIRIVIANYKICGIIYSD